uniref:Uncharacterized protein n=1 Tax=Panagrolaimus superbus TaxID=310955 RepID=A0A914YAF2_9BILA
MKPSVKRKALTKIAPKLESLILQSQKQIPTSLFSQNSNFFKKDASGNFIGFCIKTFAILCAENLVKKEDDENDGVPFEAPEDHQECVDDLQSIIMADLDILKDKKFYDYLLQSLNDHRGKLDGFDNVTMRPEFTQEFFASYWLDLMKCAHFDNVPLVTVEDHDHQGKIVNGFDSIHRSLFEVCESRIDLRLTTRFVITGIKLADEEETALRNLFMLILLFVSEWVADQQEDCPHITLKQPMARLVHACFSKLFKDIYYGKDESFKNFIFDENKENSPPPPFIFSPNRSFNTSDLSGFNITPNVQRHNEIENETILDRLSETNEALMKAVNLKTDKERKLLADYKHLQETLNAQTLEMVAIKKLNDEYSEEKQSLQHNLVKTKNELIQIEIEKKNEIESLNCTVSELQMHQDLLKNQLANATLETDNLKNDIDELTEAKRTKLCKM